MVDLKLSYRYPGIEHKSEGRGLSGTFVALQADFIDFLSFTIPNTTTKVTKNPRIPISRDER
jgi:hypothetical protein